MNKKMNISKLLIVFFTAIILFGCVDKNNNQDVEADIFNTTKASDIAKEYLDFISIGDLNGANKLCKQELLEANKNIGVGTSRIISYAQENLIESGMSAYVVFNVVRSSDSEPKCDLDNFSIKIEKSGEDYKISEVKAINKGQVFVKNNTLRMIGEDGGKSDLIVKLSDMPRDIYPRDNKVMLYKEPSPNQAFDIVALSYTGKKVAISTTGDNSQFVSIGYIENSKQTASGSGSTTSNNSQLEQSLEGILEKPIAKKVVPVDVLKDCSINDFIFSQEEEELIIEYTSNLSVNRIKVYKSDDGTPVDFGIDDKFPEDKYNIKVVGLDKNKIFIKVEAANKSENIDKEILGKYEVDTEKSNINKL
ncbi:hypothetical protein [Clostridium chauvoei]|uniref:Lipoprotein n=2 Tax=Clostridium chauvoei TaxID=46867 RepID=A0ABD4RHB5_9CLOT|nr:hypothetical protein [Clostridium chauvoei]MBX7280434.1 hypothetical protein [Clostridium chauvoei]MBX7282919.1 hypothetical protein [Clostridium chauvoei]MBX7285325.1 hypothetical protein [Clostridium chauvoei]MBX7287753.1 hypothetical protein [Clostridium chauvoei]MBX7290521.1 hypothetical protein [Clostridium chauvoei]